MSNLLDWVEQEFLADEFKDLTQAQFGDIMHGDEYDEDYKQKVLEYVNNQGGYDCLP